MFTVHEECLTIARLAEREQERVALQRACEARRAASAAPEDGTAITERPGPSWLTLWWMALVQAIGRP
jgi:hypothetical protein